MKYMNVILVRKSSDYLKAGNAYKIFLEQNGCAQVWINYKTQVCISLKDHSFIVCHGITLDEINTLGYVYEEDLED